ncbi:MAG: glycosyltransferase family 2 protein [Pseudomonadota bacterium]
MKISIVTVVRNGRTTLPRMLASLHAQSHTRIEHIVQDGGSTDGTQEYLRANGFPGMQLESAPDDGIYDAINKGIKRATGSVIGLLHADDMLANRGVVASIAEAFADPEVDGVYGDLQYVARDDVTRVIRNWRAGRFNRAALRRGWMPPHPTLYLRREIFGHAGLYDTSYRISGDYEGMLRFLSDEELTLHYIPQTLVRMRMGGVSNQSLRQMLRKSGEDYRAIRKNKVGGVGTLLAKNLRKLPQFIARDQV